VLDRLVDEANRQFSICNACRYCEGLCSVFPAMELQSAFRAGDVSYLSSLCHDCGACVPACPFAPPHEFAVDIRALMAEARVQTFEDYARPHALWRLLARGRTVAGIVVATIVFATIVAVATHAGAVVESHTGSGAFYDVIGFVWIIVPALVISVFGLIAILVGLSSFAAETPGGARRLRNAAAHRSALRDSLGLLNLGGGGGGCETVGETLSTRRRYLHHLIFYGFVLMVIATVSAAFEQDILSIEPPYAILSAPVLLGTIGGIATTIGLCGFIAIGVRRGRHVRDDASGSRRFDRVFSMTLLAATVTGLLTLALRTTPAMGPALILHLGTLGGLLLTLPYSKFVHGFYRYVALVRYHVESRESSLEQAADVEDAFRVDTAVEAVDAGIEA
jgi:citrate/tricarballylate utilization protein